ncbi:DUF933 domain-containing protein [Candidatus Omnitrophota bacterium]
MKIGLFSTPGINPGKHNIKDPRLDQVHSATQSKKKTYLQVEFVGQEGLKEADAILLPKDKSADLILEDLQFIETRFSRSTEEPEKELLNRLKEILEKEEFIFRAALSDEDRDAISGYDLLTARPVIVAGQDQLSNPDALLTAALKDAGYISFFTTAGGKETRAWMVKQGASAQEAAGAIHSDIQKGFIRAEVIGFDDFINAGGETKAKQAGKMRLEQKDYVVQDADVINFRFNK